MTVRLYSVSISHPARAARLMLEHKGIEYETVSIPAGLQAVRMRLAGFRGGTVPALQIDARRVVGSTAISRALDELKPDPPLFPRDPDHHRAVREAEAWGERVLQPIPRRLVRWAVRHHHSARVEFARLVGAPRPELVAYAFVPVAAFYARREGASRTERIQADWRALPAHLDRVDGLVEAGTIGGPELNAADFQIGTTLGVMLSSPDFAPLVSRRPAEGVARRVWPDVRQALPPLLPAELRTQEPD